MAVKDILRKVAADVGATNYATDAATRSRLLELINEAAEELWENNDLPGCLRELFVRVPADYVIFLPSYVGELRSIRDTDLRRPWTLSDLRPRYHVHEWPSNWMGWRFIGTSAIKAEITNSAPFTLAIPVADSELEITITGQTANAARRADTITMSALSNLATLGFTSVDAIRANKLPTYDVTITDADDNEIAVLHSNSLETRYLMYDVSEYPSVGNCSDNTRLMEVLYKMRLPRLENDDDLFPVPEYDKILASKTVQLFAERQQGGEERAIMMHKKVDMLVKKKQQDKTGHLEKKIKFAEDPLLGMFRNSWGPSRRSGGRYG